MKVRTLAAALTVLALAAGCSSGTTTSDAGADDAATQTPAAAATPEQAAAADPSAEIDALFDDFSVSVLSLTGVPAGASLEEILASYREGVSALDRMAQGLQDGVPDVPTDLTSAAYDASVASSTSLQAMIACFETSVAAGECDPEVTASGDRNYELGQAMGALIEYGTRSQDEVLAMLDPDQAGATGSPDAADSGSMGESSAAAAPVPTADTGEATFSIDCYDATYSTYAEAWVTQHDDCQGIYLTGTPTEQQVKAAATQDEVAVEELSPDDVIDTLEYVYGMCAQSGPESYDYLVVDEVDRSSQAAEFQAALMLCPDHPDAAEIKKRVKAVIAAASGPRDIFGGGLQRVNKDIQPGTYVSKNNSGGCYWERLNRNGDIIDNNFTNGSRVQATISANDFEFNSENCNTWRKQ